jgi:hypothetical protein
VEVRGWTPFVGLQLRYNMLDRQVEHVLHNAQVAAWCLRQAELAEVNALLERGRSQP